MKSVSRREESKIYIKEIIKDTRSSQKQQNTCFLVIQQTALQLYK